MLGEIYKMSNKKTITIEEEEFYSGELSLWNRLKMCFAILVGRRFVAKNKRTVVVSDKQNLRLQDNNMKITDTYRKSFTESLESIKVVCPTCPLPHSLTSKEIKYIVDNGERRANALFDAKLTELEERLIKLPWNTDRSYVVLDDVLSLIREMREGK